MEPGGTARSLLSVDKSVVICCWEGGKPGRAGSSGHGVHHPCDDDRFAQQVASVHHTLLHQGHLLWGNIQTQVATTQNEPISSSGNAGKVVQGCAVLQLQTESPQHR